MYYVLSTNTRPAAHIPYFAASGGNAPALTAAKDAAMIAAGLAHSFHTVGNALNNIFIEKWTDKATYDAWYAAHKAAVDAYDAARAAYNTLNGITHTETSFESTDVLF